MKSYFTIFICFISSIILSQNVILPHCGHLTPIEPDDNFLINNNCSKESSGAIHFHFKLQISNAIQEMSNDLFLVLKNSTSSIIGTELIVKDNIIYNDHCCGSTIGYYYGVMQIDVSFFCHKSDIFNLIGITFFQIDFMTTDQLGNLTALSYEEKIKLFPRNCFNDSDDILDSNYEREFCIECDEFNSVAIDTTESKGHYNKVYPDPNIVSIKVKNNPILENLNLHLNNYNQTPITIVISNGFNIPRKIDINRLTTFISVDSEILFEGLNYLTFIQNNKVIQTTIVFK